MKLKKFLTILMFSVLALSGLMFGCQDKYKNFSIKVNGDDEIVLETSENATDEKPNTVNVEISIKNAPNDNCRNISYTVSQNIVAVEEISSSSKDIKKYKITALDNITATDPSCVIEFFALKGTKNERKCELKVFVEIPLSSLSANSGYTESVVADGNAYYINVNRAISFYPQNTTQRSVEFSLVENQSVEGVSLNSKTGEIRINAKDFYAQTSIPSKIKVLVKSTDADVASTEIEVQVLKEISDEDVTLSYSFDGEKSFSFSGAGEIINKDDAEIKPTEKSISSLIKDGITLASNLESNKNANFSVGINTKFGWDFDDIDCEIENIVLSNALIQTNASLDTKNLKNFVIFSTNSGADLMKITLSYKNVEGYEKTYVIPVKVLEYPMSLIVNSSLASEYDIFDFYQNNFVGEEFSVKISQIGAYDKKFKVYITESDFDKIEIRFNGELLSYDEVISRVFENESQLFVLAKNIENPNDKVNILFYSNILSGKLNENINLETGNLFEGGLEAQDLYKNLFKNLTLNLIAGVKTVSFDETLTENEYFVEETSQSLIIPFKVNGGDVSLVQYIDIEFESGAEFVEIEKTSTLTGGQFTLKPIKNSRGNSVVFFLKSENGVSTLSKKMSIYSSYDETDSAKFEFDLSSNFIKKIKSTDSDGNEIVTNYIGTTYGKNNANFRVLNYQNATIFGVSAKTNNDAVKVNILSSDELLFNLFATENTEKTVVVEIKLSVYVKNGDDFDRKEVSISFEIKTYEPLSTIMFKNGKMTSEIEVYDSEGLDFESKTNGLNQIDLNDLIIVNGKSADDNSLVVKYFYPTGFNAGENADFESEEVENKNFNKLTFHAYKNHSNEFVDGKFIIGLSIEVFDLEGSNESYVLSLKIVLKTVTNPDKVKINSDMGFVYLANTGSGVSQINAEVVGKNSKEVTNKNLYFEVVEGSSVVVDSKTGVVNMQSSGLTKVKVCAKGSQYSENGEYSIYSYVWVVVADGSEAYPYILQSVNDFSDNKYFTLNKDFVLNNQITKNVGGINGKFAYTKYANSNYSEDSVYGLVFNGNGSVFEGALQTKLENLNVYYNKNTVSISDDFGLIAKENGEENIIENLSLYVNGIQINNEKENIFVGLMFATNNGTIKNCFISGVENNKTTIVLNGKTVNFGGFVAENNGKILGSFDFVKNVNTQMASLKIVDLTTGIENSVGGVVAKNNGTLSGIKIEAEITTNAKYVGGIAGTIESTNIEYKNLYFAGNIKATNNSGVVGGIAGNVVSDVKDEINETKTTHKTDFSLIFVEFLGNVNKNEANISGNIVGGLFGNVSFKGNNQTNVKYAYVENFAVLNENSANVKGNIAGGLFGKIASSAKIQAVFSDIEIKANTNVGGAFVGEMNGNLCVDSAYSKSTGVSNLIGARKNGKLILTKVYSTTCDETKITGDNFTHFFNKNNYLETVNEIEDGNYVFRSGNFAYLSTKNGGLPYLVYNESDGYKQLYTIVAVSVDAKFVVKNEVENSGKTQNYGNSENIVVISDTELDKAVIYFKDGLEYDIFEILNISTTPVSAVKDFIITSSDTKVIKVVNGKFVVNGLGNATITIYPKHNQSIKTYVYISVINKIEEINLSENIVINKGETKQIDANVLPKVEFNGIYFDLKENEVSEKILINNKIANNNNKLSVVDERILMMALDVFESTKIYAYGFTKVEFDGVEFDFVHFDTLKTANLSAVEFASLISPSVNYFEIPENDSVSFEVYVDSNAENQDLVFDLEGDENFSEYFDLVKCDGVKDLNLTKYNVILKAKNNNLSDNKYVKIVIKHKINGVLNENISANIDAVIKSSSLQSVELNHYSSSVTYYDSYNFIIDKETTPNFNITKGNFGVLSINLYPSYANITSVEITSSVESGNRIGFSQLEFNENNKLVVKNHKSNLATGIKLDVNKEKLTSNGGNLYVATLLSTNVLTDTVFTITVKGYYGINGKIEQTITLTAKPLTTIMLTNPEGEREFLLPKGSEITIDVNAVNMNEDFAGISESNFIFEIVDNNNEKRELVKLYSNENDNASSKINGFEMRIDPETQSIFGFKVNRNENDKTKATLIVFSDILNSEDITLSVRTTYTVFENGKTTTNEGNSINIKVVNFVVTNVLIENSEDGILKNYLGNSSLLKAKLETRKFGDIYYYDENGDEIEKLYYKDRENNKVKIGKISSFYEDEDTKKSRKDVKEEIENEILKIEKEISFSNYAWNLVSTNAGGNKVLNNIKENTTYSNFKVQINDDGYYVIYGTKVSQNNMLCKVNMSYKNGKATLDRTADYEIRTEFVLDIQTYTSLDHPEPIRTSEEFMTKMIDGGNYILLSDITLPSNFGGIDAKISSFDGNNKIINIQGFNIDSTSQTNVGLFNEIFEDTIIKNVTVNILPTFFEDDDGYYYGLNINAQNLSSINFGVLCGTNNGVITNCHVVNHNVKLITNTNIYKNLNINVYCKEDIEAKVGGFVGVNNGYITSSSFGDKDSENMLTIRAKAQIGGFASENNKKIASSYAVNVEIHNNSLTKLTAGFVAVNSDNASVTTSYVQGYSEKPAEIKNFIRLTEGGIFANGYVGGFVSTNEGSVKDCYSNILITTNKRSSGFVYDNTSGSVETSISFSSASKETQSFRYFTGNDEENVTLNNNGIKYCYYFLEEANIDGGEGEYDEPANAISNIDDAQYFEGFICDGTESAIWSFKKGFNPRIVDADQEIICERQLIEDESITGQTQQYNYIYTINNIGTYNNPIIVSTTEQFFDALTDENNLYEYYYNGKIRKTNINYKYISIVKDLDLSKIIDKNNIEQNSTSEVQKLQDIIFAGNLNANNMLLENLTITAKNDKVKYSSFGLFKQIGVETTYDNNLNIDNSYLDDDNCTVIKNANFEIDGISATITKTVGTLSGEIINSKLYNINVYSDNNVVVEGENIVGGVAGRISGNSRVKGVSSNLSVKATHETKSSNYEYQYETTKNIYRNAYDVITDENNQDINIVGGIFGVVDIYQTTIQNKVQKAGSMSYYVEAVIERELEEDFTVAPVQFTKVYGDVSISGDIVGGMFGLVMEGSTIYDARFVLNESSTQNLIANYSVGGICGINKGFISYATVEAELSRQREIDKTKQSGYTNSYLFSNQSNKATFVGGLVGIIKNGILKYSYNKANIVATNSRFVGASVGALENGQIDFVYANSLLKAQSEINENGLITRQKGYAGFVGTIVAFNETSLINSVVSILRNETDETDFGLAGMIGYNQVKDISSGKINGETTFGNIYNGNVLEGIDGKVAKNDYEDYLTYDSGTFVDYKNNECFKAPIKNLDTFYRLTYNKKGAVKSIASEDDLYNMLSTGGDCVLTSDIYLTKPWSPISSFSGSLSSERRENRQDGQSEYYVIYNLTINTSHSKNISNNIGFFATTKNARIENVTFVVGSTYLDPTPNIDPSKDSNPDPTTTNSNWGIDEFGNVPKQLGISIDNKNATEKLSLGVLSAGDTSSRINNITIRFENKNQNNQNAIISTNLNYVGGLIGNADYTTIENLTIENLGIKRESSKTHTAYVGGIVGKSNNVTYSNITFKGYSQVNNLQKANATGFVGGLVGYSENDKIDNIKFAEKQKNLSVSYETAENSSKNDCYIYIGGVFGYGNSSSVRDSNFNAVNITVLIKNPKIRHMAVGGICGYSTEMEIDKIVLSSEGTLKIENTNENVAGESDTAIERLVGGICGFSEKGSITNILSSISVDFQDASTVGYSYVGGIVGKNGDKNAGSENSNIICKSHMNVKNKSQNLYVGGIAGKNVSNSGNVSNALFVGIIKFAGIEVSNIGGICGIDGELTKSGRGEKFENFANSYFIEDLSLTPARVVEFGTAEKYSEFVNNNNGYSTFVDNINNSDVAKFFKDNDEDIYEISGDTISFIKGSVLNPIKVSEVMVEITTTESLTTSELKIGNDSSNESFENGKYYLIEKDLTISSTAQYFATDVIKGYIIGDGKKITTNKTFANEIDSNAIISGVIFELSSKDTITFNGNTFVNGVKSIVANTNNGVIYNTIVKGNMYVDNTNIAPVAIENAGIINVVTSFGHIVAKDVSKNSAYVSGFVEENSGAVYNSVSIGNMEYIKNTYNILTKDNTNKFFGFVRENSDTMINCVSAMALPVKDSSSAVNSSFGNDNSSNAEFKNCYVDICANGYYLETLNSKVKYLNFNEIFNINNCKFKDGKEIDKIYITNSDNKLNNLWSENKIDVMFGYAYPSISTYKTINENEVIGSFADEILNTTEIGKDDKNNETTYYLINNLSSYNYVINKLNEKENTDIFVKQIASFMGRIENKSSESGNNSVALSNQTIKLENNLNYNGNNFAIYGLNLSSYIDNNNSYTGLFLSGNNDITIINLALVEMEAKINFATNGSAYTNVYAGAFVAKSSGSVSISGCYASGTIEANVGNSDISYAKAQNFVIGGFVGDVNTSGDVKISNNVSKLDINIDNINAKIYQISNTITKSGYNGIIGGIVGDAKNSSDAKIEISNNYNLGDVSCASVQSLYMGGIAGQLNNATLSNNAYFGAVAYKGAYLGYYKNGEGTEYFYNINAILGNKGSNVTFDTSNINKYNSALNLVEDEFVKSETELKTLIKYISTDNLKSSFNGKNNFVYDENGATKLFEIGIEIIENGNLSTSDDGKKYFEFKDNTFYIVNATDDFEFRCAKVVDNGGVEQETKSLKNTKIIFSEPHKITISENIFDELTNCTISNLIIQADNTLTTTALAKKITNTKLYKITVNEINFDREKYDEQDNSNNYGGLVDYATGSIFAEININYGRFCVNASGNVNAGAVCGKADTTLFSNCLNTATVTTISSENTNTAGIVGSSTDGYLFHCTNDGLVYAKNNGEGGLNVAAITNGVDSVISFCENKQNVKSVHKSSNKSVTNKASGISNDGQVLFCVSKANIIAISGNGTESKNIVANGIGGDSVYYSYNYGAVMSTSKVYTLTSANAYYSYSLGGGYSSLSQFDSLPPLANSKNETIFNTDDITKSEGGYNETTGKSWIVTFIELVNDSGCYDFYITNPLTATDENGNQTTTYDKSSQPVIRLLDGTDGFKIPLSEDETTYQISSALELWWWSRYESHTKNVVLLDDIDMTGYSYLTPESFSGKFDGNYHTVSSLTIYSTPATVDKSQVWGFVGINNGTIQNINFENPSLKITETEETKFITSNYISIVAGINNGTISNIIVGQVSEANSFITVDYTTNEMSQEDTTICIGTIVGANMGTISGCYVINLSDVAINSEIELKNNETDELKNICLYIGGIAGFHYSASWNSVSASITNNSFLSGVKSKLTNMTYKMKMWLAYYSHATQIFGLIVGCPLSDGVENNFAIDSQDLYYIETSTLKETMKSGNEDSVTTNEDEKSNYGLFGLSGVVGTLGGLAVGTLGTMGVIKVVPVLVATGPVGWIAGGIVAAAVALVFTGEAIGQDINNSNSCQQCFHAYGYSADIITGQDITMLDINSQYMSIYNENISTFANQIIYEDGSKTYRKLPYNENFLKLSKLKTEPKKVDGKYYVYNVNEFAYALSQNSVTSIVLMDHIDMTKKVWDDGLTLKSGLTIIDNGFKVVCGSNCKTKTDEYDKTVIDFEDNTTFAGKFKEVYGEDLAKELLVYSTDDIKALNDDYGKFDTIKKDYTKAAYAAFEERFIKAWEDANAKDTNKDVNDSDYDATNKLESIIDSANKIYYIDYVEQIEVVADALQEYYLDGTLHKAINFYGYKFVIRKDITLSANLSSFDGYEYSKNETMHWDNNVLTEGAPDSDEGIVYKAPEFVSENGAVKKIDNKGGIFNGIIDGGNHIITINSLNSENGNQCLISAIGSSAIIKNLTVDATNLSKVKTSFITQLNYGKIENISVKTAGSCTYERELNYSDGVGSIDDAKTEIDSNFVNSFGLLVYENIGTIDGLKLETTEINISSTYTITDVGNNEDNVSVEKDSKMQTIDINSNPYNTYTRKLTVTSTFGLFVGTNIGTITNITTNELTVNYKPTINTDKTYYLKKVGNGGYDKTVKVIAGIISAKNVYNNDVQNAKLSHIKIINSTLNLNSISINDGYFGLISGMSELGFDSCSVFGSNIIVDGENSSESTHLGALVGVIAPAIYSVDKNIEQNVTVTNPVNNEEGTISGITHIKIYTAHIPQIINCFTTTYNFYGESWNIIISKRENQIDENSGEEKKCSTYYYGNQEEKILGYIDYFYMQVPEDLASDKDGNITSGYDNSENEEITINLTDSTSMDKFDKSVITSNAITLKAFVEDKIDGDVKDENDNIIETPQGEIEWDGKIQVKLKLTLKETITQIDENGNKTSINPYCFMTDGGKVYVSNDKSLSDFVTILFGKVVSEDEDQDGWKYINDAGVLNTSYSNQTIKINGEEYTGTATYSGSVNIDGSSYSITITYSDLKKIKQ